MGTRLKIFVIALGLIALVLGAYGVFGLLDPAIPLRWRIAESIYTAIQLFTISYPDYLAFAPGDQGDPYLMNTALQFARFLAPLVSITAVISLFSSAMEKWFKRLRVKYAYKRHAVIFGFNLRSRMICEELVNRGIRVVLADSNLETGDLEWLRKKGVIAFSLSGLDSSDPATCRVERANYLFAVHEEDSLNLKILVRMYQRNKEVFGSEEYAKKAKKAAEINTRCFVHFSEISFKQLKFGNQFSDLDDFFNLRVFSVYDHSARLLTRSIYKKYAKDILEGKQLRIILIGTGSTGQALLEQLVRMSFFRKDRKASICVFDENEEGRKALEARFPVLSLDRDYYDEEDIGKLEMLKEQIGFPEIEFAEMPFDSASLLTGQAIARELEHEEVAIAILSSADATRNLAIADALIQQNRVAISEIFVRTDEKDSDIRQYVRSELERKSLSGFPTLDEICKLDNLEEGAVEALAQTIHEEYLQEFGAQTGDQPSAESWQKLEETFKESNRRAASHLEIKCSLLGMAYLDLDDTITVRKAISSIREQMEDNAFDSYLERLAECEHSRWCIEKLLDGWVPGTRRNDSTKRHPNLIPWEIEQPEVVEAFKGFEALTENDKQKDRNNIEKIPLLLEALVATREGNR